MIKNHADHPLSPLTELRLSISKRHIDQGVRHDPLRCPLALALNEQLPVKETTQIHVQTPRTFITYRDQEYQLRHHTRLTAWIKVYEQPDGRWISAPIDLSLRLIPNLLGNLHPCLELDGAELTGYLVPRSEYAQRNAAIIAALEQGMTVRRAAKEFGISHARVGQIAIAARKKADQSE